MKVDWERKCCIGVQPATSGATPYVFYFRFYRRLIHLRCPFIFLLMTETLSWWQRITTHSGDIPGSCCPTTAARRGMYRCGKYSLSMPHVNPVPVLSYQDHATLYQEFRFKLLICRRMRSLRVGSSIDAAWTMDIKKDSRSTVGLATKVDYRSWLIAFAIIHQKGGVILVTEGVLYDLHMLREMPDPLFQQTELEHESRYVNVSLFIKWWAWEPL